MKKNQILLILILSCVIVPNVWAEPYTINGDGTATDVSTGLTWQVSHAVATWSQAGLYCQGLSLAGGGWRLPSIKEILSLVDDKVFGPATDRDVFSTAPGNVWSATEYPYDVDLAWLVYTYPGDIDTGSKAATYGVRCVR